MMDEPARPGTLDVSSREPGLLSRLSIIWLVPILALVISLFVAWQSYSNRGTLISIEFANASGVEAERTPIKFRDVVIGTVESVHFAKDMNSVIVEARVDQNVVPYLDDDAQFWVVRPSVSARGISGLDTVLSGVFISGTWNPEAGTARTEFKGLDNPPSSRSDQNGTTITLRAPDSGSLSSGAPLLFKGIEVGQIDNLRLSARGDAVLMDAFIQAPNDRNITTATRFWNTSGFTVSLGAGGVSLDVNSLASLIEGGISFDTVYSGGRAVENGQVFDIFETEDDARESAFDTQSAEVVNVSVLFNESVRGLTVGGAVEFRGIRVGEVTELTAFVEERPDGELGRVRLLTNLAISPSRLGLPDGSGEVDTLTFLRDSVARGLRARIASANILTGALIVELVQLPDAPVAELDLQGDPYPTMPSAESNLGDFTATAEGVLERINKLPIEELMTSAIALLNSLEDVVASDDTQSVPATVVALLEDIRGVVGSEELAGAPAQVKQALDSVNTLLATLETSGAADQLVAAIEAAGVAAKDMETASGRFPQIAEDVAALSAKANALPIDELLTSSRSLVATLDGLAQSDAIKDLPDALGQALLQVKGFLAALEDGGAVENLNATLKSTAVASDKLAVATDDIPDLVKRLNAVAAQATATLGAYDETSPLNAEARATIREIRDAAKAMTSLARTIERRPNSLLIGR